MKRRAAEEIGGLHFTRDREMALHNNKSEMTSALFVTTEDMYNK
jgi:hypothetical protein